MATSDTNAQNNTTLQHPGLWKTGDEPATTAQVSYLETLTREAHEEWHSDPSLTKAEAAVQIEQFQKKTGRGQA